MQTDQQQLACISLPDIVCCKTGEMQGFRDMQHAPESGLAAHWNCTAHVECGVGDVTCAKIDTVVSQTVVMELSTRAARAGSVRRLWTQRGSLHARVLRRPFTCIADRHTDVACRGNLHADFEGGSHREGVLLRGRPHAAPDVRRSRRQAGGLQ